MNHSFLPENVAVRTEDLEITRIVVRERQRKVNAEHVALLRASMQETGRQIVSIAVSERPDGTCVLIDGAHRLEAAEQNGRTTIRSDIYTNLDDEQEGVLEFVTNRARRDLSPAEILEGWETFGLPLYRLKAQENKANGALKSLVGRGHIDDSWITADSSNPGITESSALAAATVAQTGHDPRTLEKIAAVRDLAKDEDAPDAVREAAKRGYEKLQSATTKIEPVYKSVQKMREAVLRQSEDPQVLLERDAEDRLDEIVRHTTLLKEKLDGDLREFLRVAGRKDQMGRDMLRATRVALVHALTSVVVVECEVRENAAQNLQSIGQEVTTLLSQEAMKALGLRQAGAEDSRV